MRVTPLHPHIGARAEGVDLRSPLTAELRAAIEAAMDRHAVLVFPGQDLDDDQQMAFGAAFGPIERTPATVDAQKRRLKHAQMNDISNLDANGEILKADDRRRMFNLGNRLWHSDSSFKNTPSKYSLLHARSIPPEGGETEFADMRAAWDALSEEQKAALDGLVALHDVFWSRGQIGFTEFPPGEREQFPPSRQRLVRRHPGSGRKGLYLSAHASHILGWPVPEGRLLLADLTEHATRRAFVYSHRWREGDLVIWDNRDTMHRGRPHDERFPRDLRRATTLDTGSTLDEAA